MIDRSYRREESSRLIVPQVDGPQTGILRERQSQRFGARVTDVVVRQDQVLERLVQAQSPVQPKAANLIRGQTFTQGKQLGGAGTRKGQGMTSDLAKAAAPASQIL